MAKTKHDKLMDHLTAKGYHVVPAASRKYTKMVKGEQVYWLGRAGALLAGPTLSKAISLTAYLKPSIFEEAA